MSLAYDAFDRNGTLATRLDAELRRAHPRTILESAIESFGDKLALVSSFGAESAVLLHLISEV
jgi:phosphoadenosine phosphosulfate reductase